MGKKYRYNIISDNISDDAIIENVENNALKSAGASIAIWAFAGVSLLNIPTHDVIRLDQCSQLSYEINCNRNIRNNIYILENTLDLLKVENINKINKIKAFEDDWNGNGATRFTQDAINMFIDVINALHKQPRIAPTGKSSMLMQYELDDNSLLAFDVAVGRVEKVFVPQGAFENASVEVFTENIIDRMNQCVELFYGIG